MTDPTPFRPDQAEDAHPQRAGDFLLPICLPKPGLLLGEDLAVLALTTLEGQRVGVPMGMQVPSDLREVVTEALRMMQAGMGTRCSERSLISPLAKRRALEPRPDRRALLSTDYIKLFLNLGKIRIWRLTN